MEWRLKDGGNAMPVTKSDLIEQLSESLKLPKGKAELVVNIMFDSMVAALQRGERIEIRGFGSFEVRSYKAYEGRNPRTGEPVHVKPKRLPFFKVGKELRERVNAGTGAIEADDHDEDVVDEAEMGNSDEADDQP
jgi:integration host factor subunit beta